jgi:hypothetical protein
MYEAGIWFRLVIIVLATWRITHLLAKEDGPAYIIARFRVWVGDGLLGQLMDCFKCMSLWVAAPLTLLVFHRPLEWMVGWLATSGAACLLERIGQQPVVIQPFTQTQEGGKDNGMLWTETTGSKESGGAHDEANVPAADSK